MGHDRLIGRNNHLAGTFIGIACVIFAVVVGARIPFESVFLSSTLLLKYWKGLLLVAALGLGTGHTYLNDGFGTALLISILLLEGFVIAASWGSTEITLTALGWGLGAGWVIGVLGYALGAIFQSTTATRTSGPAN